MRKATSSNLHEATIVTLVASSEKQNNIITKALAQGNNNNMRMQQAHEKKIERGKALVS